MKTPREIYTAYKIMPALQTHQLRVAAVGKLICDNFNGPVNSSDVILACLFHDMGNIVKFNLRKFPQFSEPEGVEYWERIQKEVIGKYGPEQHTASAAIAREIGLPERVIQLVNNSAFRKIPEIIESPSWEWKISKYSDLRVAPEGIVSVQDRLKDFGKRYGASGEDLETFAQVQVIEGQIFEHCSIQPENINDKTVAPLIGELSDYPVA